MIDTMIVERVSSEGSLVIEACSGKRTIWETEGVFSSATVPVGVHVDGRDASFEAFNVAGHATGLQKVKRFNVVKKHTNPIEVFGALNIIRLSELCFTQDQIVSYVEKYPQKLVQHDGYTVFLFQVDKDFFVAYTKVPYYGVNIYSQKLDYPMWNLYRTHRIEIVVPEFPKK
jgi:hypothetical protein